MTNYSGAVPETPRAKDWRDDALCREHPDDDLWFPKGHEGHWQLVIAEAKQVCRRCPVANDCLQFALNTKGMTDGIFGGLTAPERASLRRSRTRYQLGEQETTQRIQAARRQTQPKQPPASFQDLLDRHTVRLIHGHLAWNGPKRASFKGREYTPKQIAYIADRGHEPAGHVRATCGISGCVLAAHIADEDERQVCGTRPGYQRHLREGSKPCPECKKANTDADNLLRRTGSTKAVAR